MKISFVQAGGTMDKIYPRGAMHHGYNFEIGDPAFARILQKVNPRFTWESFSMIKKDSLDITEEDRKQLVQEIEAMKDDKIVVTHGTDTIHLTARKLSLSSKTIVLTGSMLPEKFYESDAMFNLGMAVAAVQTLGAGVYIALHGEVVPWREFRHE